MMTADSRTRPATLSGLQVSNLSAGYPRRPVLRELTLPAMAAGSTVALVGPNGAGKSTLLRALAGLVHASGSILLDGQELTGASLRERAKLIAFMPQSIPERVALTVLEGVMSAIHASPLGASSVAGSVEVRHLAMEALERVGVAHLALERLDRLSGGQRQLASLAQAIARAPKLLLLDEPTSALDLRHQVTVMSLVRELAVEGDGRVVVVVVHDLNLAVRWADTIVVMDGGQLRASGVPEDAVSADVLRAVYGVEARVERCSRGRIHVMVDGIAEEGAGARVNDGEALPGMPSGGAGRRA